MKDLTKLTPEEAQRIETVLILLHRDFANHITAQERLSKDEDFCEEVRKTFASNAKWLKEIYLMIYETDNEKLIKNSYYGRSTNEQ